MPERVIFIETPGLTWGGKFQFGAFVSVVETAGNKQLFATFIDEETEFEPSGHNFQIVINDEAKEPIVPADDKEFAGFSLTSLLLYICTANGEITTPKGEPQSKILSERTRGGKPQHASKDTKWHVGLKIGSALKKAREEYEAEVGRFDASSLNGGSKVAPHVRRAHWHHFWEGPTNDPTQRRRTAKWISPIFVNDDGRELSATIHPVI